MYRFINKLKSILHQMKDTGGILKVGKKLILLKQIVALLVF